MHPHRDHHADASEGDVNLSPGRAAFAERRRNDPARPLLDRDAAVYLHQSLSTPCLNALSGARGSRLTDVAGRSILDFHGNSVHQIGHGHPAVVAAIKQQLDRLPFCPRRYTNEPAVELAERLSALTGKRLSKILLAPGGGAAMGIAMKLARFATGRFKTVSMWGSFHGASIDTISIGGEEVFRRGLGPLLPGAEHAPACAPTRCMLGCGGVCSLACANAVEEILRREGDVGAVIAEPVRCTTIDIPPAAYWQRIRELCDRSNALLIFDEIPTCLGRTGRMFSFEHFGVLPDIVVIGKGLGGGIIPQAAVLARADLDVASETALGHYTHEKSPLGAAAALATLDVIKREGLVQRAATVGDRWMRSLREALTPTGRIREIRGLGLLVGVELADSPGLPAPILADRVLYACLEAGLNFKVSDGRVLTLTPPLNVDEADLEAATVMLREAISA